MASRRGGGKRASAGDTSGRPAGVQVTGGRPSDPCSPMRASRVWAAAGQSHLQALAGQSDGAAPTPWPAVHVPVVNLGLVGGSCTDMGKVADAGEDCARDRGRWPPKDTGMPAASMDAW